MRLPNGEFIGVHLGSQKKCLNPCPGSGRDSDCIKAFGVPQHS